MFRNKHPTIQKVKIYRLRPASPAVSSDEQFVVDGAKASGWRKPVVKILLRLLDAKRVSYSDYDFSDDEIILSDVVRYISDQIKIIEAIMLREPKYLIVGRDGMRALKTRMAYGAFSFPSKYESDDENKYVNHLFGGLKVVLVPWYSGLLVLPSLDTETQPIPTSD